MTNGLTLIAVLLLTWFYVELGLFDTKRSWLAAAGLFLLTVGMVIDELSWIYWGSTLLATLSTIVGAIRNSK